MRALENQKIREDVRDKIMPRLIASLPLLIRVLLKIFFPEWEKIIYEENAKTTQEILDWQELIKD